MIDWNKPLIFPGNPLNWDITKVTTLRNTQNRVVEISLSKENKWHHNSESWLCDSEGKAINYCGNFQVVANKPEEKWRVLQTIVSIRKEFSNKDDAETYVNKQVHIEGYSYSIEKVTI